MATGPSTTINNDGITKNTSGNTIFGAGLLCGLLRTLAPPDA